MLRFKNCDDLGLIKQRIEVTHLRKQGFWFLLTKLVHAVLMCFSLECSTQLQLVHRIG